MNETRIAKAFEKIGVDAIRQAEEVKCSIEDFAEGLKDIEIAIRERRVLAESEIPEDEDNED